MIDSRFTTFVWVPVRDVEVAAEIVRKYWTDGRNCRKPFSIPTYSGQSGKVDGYIGTFPINENDVRRFVRALADVTPRIRIHVQGLSEKDKPMPVMSQAGLDKEEYKGSPTATGRKKGWVTVPTKPEKSDEVITTLGVSRSKQATDPREDGVVTVR